MYKEIMNLISTDTTDYLNRLDDILAINNVLLNDMILLSAYDIYLRWDGSLDDDENIEINDIIEHNYEYLLTYILHSEYAYHSTILLIYTIDRLLYPNENICIGVSDINIDMILYEWNSYTPENYKNICSTKELIEYLADQEGWKGELPEWSDTDITVMIPSYEGETPYYDMRLNVEEYIEDNHHIDRETKRRIYTSLLISSNVDTYKRLMYLLPPYCYKGRRYVDRGSDIDFLFQ